MRLPLARLRFRIILPSGVLIRALKPCFLYRFVRLGWNGRFIVHTSFIVSDSRTCYGKIYENKCIKIPKSEACPLISTEMGMLRQMLILSIDFQIFIVGTSAHRPRWCRRNTGSGKALRRPRRRERSLSAGPSRDVFPPASRSHASSPDPLKRVAPSGEKNPSGGPGDGQGPIRLC